MPRIDPCNDHEMLSGMHGKEALGEFEEGTDAGTVDTLTISESRDCNIHFRKQLFKQRWGGGLIGIS